MTRQVKSKQRVADHGEVFTADREVNAMLDLVKQETERVDSRFLEPACGDGNFVAEILRRKLEAAKKRAIPPKKKKPLPMEFEKQSVIAFVEQAKKMNPRYLTMIVPARWYAGGKGLDDFRDRMLTDEHIKELHDFPNTDDCFPGVNIRGGVCYFLWDKDYDNRTKLVNVVTHDQDKTDSMMRSLKYGDLDIFLRYGKSLSILEKVMTACGDNVMAKHVSSRKPFGLSTDFAKSSGFKSKPTGMDYPIPCYGKGKTIGYVEFNNIPNHQEWIGKWKVFTSRANNIGTELNDDNLNTFLGKKEICTESYIVIGADMDLSEQQAINLSEYLQTRFARFCHSLAKASQDATSKTYRFVPVQDFNKGWTDEELYKKYKLTDEEIEFIEATIKEME